MIPRRGLSVLVLAAGLSSAEACYHGTNNVSVSSGGSGGAGGQNAASATTTAAGTGAQGGTTASAGSGGHGGAGSSGSTGGSTTSTDPTGVFVAVGYGGRRVRSTDDGATWTDDQALEVDGGGDDTSLLRTIVWGQPGFVALGWRSMTSSDGKTWTDHGANIGQWLGAVVYANSQFVAVGGYGMRAVSADGVTWTNHSIDTVATHAGDALIYADVMGGRFVSANDSGQRSFSPDAVTWTYSTGETSTTTTHLAFGNGRFLGIGGTATVTSTDGGATWTAAGALPTAPDGLVFAAGTFTAVANGHVYTSTDGASWVDHAVSGLQAGPVAYGHGTYVMVNGTARRRSTDGLTWDTPVSGGVNALSWVAFGPVQ